MSLGSELKNRCIVLKHGETVIQALTRLGIKMQSGENIWDKIKDISFCYRDWLYLVMNSSIWKTADGINFIQETKFTYEIIPEGGMIRSAVAFGEALYLCISNGDIIVWSKDNKIIKTIKTNIEISTNIGADKIAYNNINDCFYIVDDAYNLWKVDQTGVSKNLGKQQGIVPGSTPTILLFNGEVYFKKDKLYKITTSDEIIAINYSHPDSKFTLSDLWGNITIYNDELICASSTSRTNSIGQRLTIFKISKDNTITTLFADQQPVHENFSRISVLCGYKNKLYIASNPFTEIFDLDTNKITWKERILQNSPNISEIFKDCLFYAPLGNATSLKYIDASGESQDVDFGFDEESWNNNLKSLQKFNAL